MQEKDATRRPQSRYAAGELETHTVHITMADDPAPATEATGVDAILNERGSRYGKFTGHAEIAQQLKGVMSLYEAKRGCFLAPDQREALSMIAHKIARIINGDPNYADSWVDIAGYAKLVADRLEGVER